MSTQTVDPKDDGTATDQKPVSERPVSQELITKPGIHDVLCGRGGAINAHSGNQAYRTLVNEQKERYNLASFKVEKAQISKEIVDLVRGRGGRFLRKERTQVWAEIEVSKAITKTSQALREGAPRIRADAVEHGVYADLKSAKRARYSDEFVPKAKFEASSSSAAGKAIATEDHPPKRIVSADQTSPPSSPLHKIALTQLPQQQALPSSSKLSQLSEVCPELYGYIRERLQYTDSICDAAVAVMHNSPEMSNAPSSLSSLFVSVFPIPFSIYNDIVADAPWNSIVIPLHPSIHPSQYQEAISAALADITETAQTPSFNKLR